MYPKDGENLSSEVKEELATLMFGIQMILKSSNAINDDSASMHLAYDILCKVSRADVWDYSASIAISFNKFAVCYQFFSAGSMQHVYNT